MDSEIIMMMNVLIHKILIINKVLKMGLIIDEKLILDGEEIEGRVLEV